MTTAELQRILQSDEKLSTNEIIEIIGELRDDCFDKIYSIPLSDNPRDRYEYGFYTGEENAFDIVLTLLSKLEKREVKG